MEPTVNDQQLPLLIIFSGLSGAGKTSLARELAHQLGAVYVRIDSIEQAILRSRAVCDTIQDAGYSVGYALAEDNLFLGQTVVADSVNPLQVTRDAWVAIAHRAQATAIEIEVTCSDAELHRQRVETRKPDIPGHQVPTWQEVGSREYDSWNRDRIVLDTANRSIPESVADLRQAIAEIAPARS
jgi:predicted kinase